MVKKIIVLSASIIAIILLCNAKKISAYIDYKNGLEYLSQGDYKQAATVFYDNYNYRNRSISIISRSICRRKTTRTADISICI